MSGSDDLRLDLLAELATSGLDSDGRARLDAQGGVDEGLLSDFERAAAALHLALMGPLEAPPEDLRERLHSDARAQRLESGGLLAGPGSGTRSATGGAARPGGPGWATWGLAAAAGLLVLGGAYHLRAVDGLRGDVDGLRAELTAEQERARGIARDLDQVREREQRTAAERDGLREEGEGLRQELADSRQQLAELEGAVDAAREELAAAGSRMEELEQQNRYQLEELDIAFNRYEQAVLEMALLQNPPPPADRRRDLLAAAPDVVQWSWSAAGDPTGQGVAGDVVWSPSRQEGYLSFEGLAPNDPLQERFQLWIFDGDRPSATPVDGGVFDVRDKGTVVVAIDPKLEIRSVAAFAVTVERPEGVVVSDRTRLALLAAE